MDRTDTADRERLIAGLREFADFLESRTDVPAPAYPRLLAFVRRDDDAEGSAEVDRVAALVGEQIDPDQMEHGHCAVTKHFGPVEDGAVYITRVAKARHDADDSYRGHVRPEEV